MLKLQVIMAQKAFNRIHEPRRKLEFDFGKLKYVNAIHSSSFPTAVGESRWFVIEGEHKISTLRAIQR
jgi:hypothetical protein